MKCLSFFLFFCPVSDNKMMLFVAPPVVPVQDFVSVATDGRVFVFDSVPSTKRILCTLPQGTLNFFQRVAYRPRNYQCVNQFLWSFGGRRQLMELWKSRQCSLRVKIDNPQEVRLCSGTMLGVPVVFWTHDHRVAREWHQQGLGSCKLFHPLLHEKEPTFPARDLDLYLKNSISKLLHQVGDEYRTQTNWKDGGSVFQPSNDTSQYCVSLSLLWKHCLFFVRPSSSGWDWDRIQTRIQSLDKEVQEIQKKSGRMTIPLKGEFWNSPDSFLPASNSFFWRFKKKELEQYPKCFQPLFSFHFPPLSPHGHLVVFHHTYFQQHVFSTFSLSQHVFFHF